MSLNVRVITPERIVWNALAEELILPTTTGQIGILTDHASLLSGLDIGVMRLKTGGIWISFVLMEGFAEIENNNITILCTGAEEAASVDSTVAQAALKKAITTVSEATTKKEKIDAAIQLRKAKARLQAIA
jgi:F-type H+-transporting ATPase subunit epsilon